MKIYKKIWFKVIIAILIIFTLLTTSFLIYASNYYRADEIAVNTLKGNDQSIVNNENKFLSFSNKNKESTIGFIFYPGGKVDETSYAPLMNLISEKGITCIILKEPLNLAVFEPDLADYALEKFPNIKEWYVGGHSLGGVIAASYASKHSDKIKGVILMGSYPINSLKEKKLRMISFYGNKDGVLNLENFEKNKINQPEDTTYYEIQGGNHSYYGNYGEQEGDLKASITRQEQQEVVVNQITKWLYL